MKRQEAVLYHRHHVRNSEDLVFWQELAKAHVGPILELGCGTGRVMLHLLLEGHPVIGLDHDLAMLQVLRENWDAQLPVAPLLVQSDMSAFRLARRFGLILLPCNTLSTLSAPARLDTLVCARQHLSPEGVFAVSLPNPAVLAALPRRGNLILDDIFPHPQDGEPVQASSAWVRTNDQITFFWHYDHMFPDGRVERATLQASHALIPADDYVSEVQRAGMTIRGLYGDFDHSAFTPDAPHLIIIAG